MKAYRLSKEENKSHRTLSEHLSRFVPEQYRGRAPDLQVLVLWRQRILPFYLIPILAEDQRSSHFTPTCLMLVDMLLKGNIRSLVQQRVTLSTKSCTCSFEPSPPAKLMMAFTRCPGDEAGVYHGAEISDDPIRTRNPASCRQNHQQY